MDMMSAAQAIAKSLNMCERGKESAKNGLPLSTATSFGVEDEIIAAVEERGRNAMEETQRVLVQAQKEMDDYQKKAHQVKTGQKSKVGWKKARQYLEEAETKKNAATAGYNEFRNENGLNRNAFDDDRKAQIMWVFVVVFAEGLLNSYFFAPAFEDGLLGGFFVAFFVSFVNVGFAFVGGVLGLRYLANHSGVNRQLLGGLCLLACTMISLLVITLSAWFRGHVDGIRSSGQLSELPATASALSDKAWEMALVSLQALDAWSMISSLNAFLLFFVGLLCTLLGFWKGYEYDDPYPGFGPVNRAKEDAEDLWHDAQESLNEQEQQHARGHEDAVATLKASFVEVNVNYNDLCKRSGEIVQLPDDLARLARQVLREFLACNASIRSSQSPAFPQEFAKDEFRQFAMAHHSFADKFTALSEEFAREEKSLASFKADAIG